MSVREDVVRTRIEIDGNQAISQIGKYENELRDLNFALKGLKKGTQEWIDTNAKINDTKTKLASVREQAGLVGMTLKQLKNYQRELNNELGNLTKGTQAYESLRAKLLQVNSAVAANTLHLKGSSKVWEFLKSEMAQFGVMALGFIGFQALFGQVQNLIGGLQKLSDQLADLRKTTGMSEQEVNQFNAALSNIDTRTSTQELRNIGIIAGQLGIAKKDILEFTEATDKLVVALGDEFTGGAEEVTKVLGGLKSIFNETRQADPSDAMLHIGNALNALGAAGSATSPVMADFANRIGGVGASLGLSAPQILALSSTLQELNVTAERGGTAVTKILQKMTTNTEEFANIAGMKLNDFKKLVNTDIYAAFVKVAEGSQKSGKSAIAFGQMMKDAELSSAGASEVFTKLGQNTELLASRLDLATSSFAATDSIMSEFNVKNENFAANMAKLQKAIAGILMNNGLTKFLEDFVYRMAQLLPPVESAQDKLRKLNDEFNTEIETLKRGNFTNEERKRLIGEINEKYGEYLPNLLSETASLQDIEKAQKAVNNEMLGRILLLDYEKEIAEAYKKEKAAIEGLYNTEKNRQKLKQGKSGLEGTQSQELAQMMDNLDKVNQHIADNTSSTVTDIEKKYAAMAERLGMSFEKLKQKASQSMSSGNKKSAGIDTSAGTTTDYNAKQREAEIAAMRDGFEKEAALLYHHYESKKQQAIKDKNFTLELDAALKSELQSNYEKLLDKYDEADAKAFEDALAKNKARARAMLEQKLQDADTTALALTNVANEEIDLEEDKQQTLLQIQLDAEERKLSILERSGIATKAEIERQKASVISTKRSLAQHEVQIERQKAQAIANVVHTFGSFISRMLSVSASNYANMTDTQKTQAGIQIAINAAEGIGGLIASAAKDPTDVTWYTKVAKIVGSAAVVVGSIAEATALLSSTNSAPQADIAPAPELPGFYYGSEYVNAPSGIDQGLAKITKGERIVPKGYNEQMDNLPNAELPAAVAVYNALKDNGSGKPKLPTEAKFPSSIKIEDESINAIAERMAQKVNNKKVELNYTYLQEEEAKLKFIKEKA